MFTEAGSAIPPRSSVVLLAAACFAAGVSVSGMFLTAAPNGTTASAYAPPAATPRGGHPAEVIRVLDGDTFEARVRIWPGMDVTTRIRLRGIDAAEMHARCDDERIKAVAAREALTKILAEGAVGISGVAQDKYGGRVDADVSTAKTANVSAEMLRRGLARAYRGGRRESWCG